MMGMTKLKFLLSLRDKLTDLPQDELEERLSFYSEMIEDRMEEGLSEEEAVLAVGDIDHIAMQIVDDIPKKKKARKEKRKLKAIEIVLLALGSPIWFSLLIAAVAVIISVYVSLWSVIVSLWSVFASFVACAFAGLILGVVFASVGKAAVGVAMIGAGIFLAGLSIFVFCGCKAATNGLLLLTKKMVLWLKNCFVRKEEV
jgi:uncharacterized membrane protein